jgi:hypothetical protein
LKRIFTILSFIFLALCLNTKAQVTANISGTNATNCIACNGAASVTVTGGTPPYTYNWSNGATTSNITGLCPGTYSVTATDHIGTTSNTPSIVIGPWVIDSVHSTSTACSSNTGTGTVYAGGGTAPYTYSWSNGATTSGINALSAGTYHITVTDANGCSATDSVIISQPFITVNYDSSGNTPCGKRQGYIAVSASGGTPPYTYQWSNSATTSYITGLSVGTYSVLVTDANGCTGTDLLSIPGIPISLSSFATPTSCGNVGSVGVTAYNGTPPLTYSWSNGATTAYVTGLSAGTYSVTVTDSGGCTGSLSQGVPSQPLKILGMAKGFGPCVANSGKACPILAGGIPLMTYIWSNGTTRDTAAGLSAGTYKVVVQDKGGCKDSATVNIAASPAVTYVNDSTADNGSCNGTLKIVVSPNAKKPLTYTWYSVKDHKWEQLVTNSDTIKIDSLCNGWVAVDIEADSIPCSLTDSVFIFGPNGVPDISVASPQILVYPNPAKGVINLSISHAELVYSPSSSVVNGVRDYNSASHPIVEIYNMLGEKVKQFNIQNPEFKIDISSLPAGQYMLRAYNKSFSKTVPFEVVK